LSASRLSSVDLVRRLVGFDTTSRDSNLALIAFVRDYLAALGVDSEQVPDETGRKANLFATLGPTDRGGVMLSGHTDVVPVDGQDWSTDPFDVVERDGRLYGRGTSDMKSFLAVVLALAPEFLARGLETPIHLAFSYDEEVGCVGVRRLIARLAERPVRPRLCIVGEPTEMRPIIGHKGKKSYWCHVRGFECHSALAHAGVNAIEAAAEIVAYLKSMARRHRDQGPFDPDYAPPYTTVHTGTIAGGTALNIVPKDCRFEFEFRYLPTDDPVALYDEVRRYAAATILPEMRSVQPGTGIEFGELTSFPGLDTGSNEEVTQWALALSGANATGRVAFGTEAGLFQEAGIPTVVCGPGSIEQAHKPDEFIALDQIRQCEAFLRRLMDRVCKEKRAT
jgi:acetylornithine deacetylase